jgi:hypothetical protein
MITLHTKPIGPDLRVEDNLKQIRNYLSKTSSNFASDIRFNLYYKLIELTKVDSEFAKLFYSLPRTQGFVYETEYVFDIDPDALSTSGHCFKHHKYFYSPTPAKIQFDIYPNHTKINSFYPGFIGAGLSGVGSELYETIEQMAKNNNSHSIFLSPIAVSKAFWSLKGFGPQFDPAMPWVKRLIW